MLLVVGLVLLLSACEGGDGDGGSQRAPQAALPAELQSGGGEVFAASGCLGCHRLGDHGNEGPGSDLTGVGGRLSRAEIERALVDPEPPMPSYSMLPGRDLDTLVGFLRRQR